MISAEDLLVAMMQLKAQPPPVEKWYFYLPKNLINQLGGAEAIEKYFDHMCEVVEVPDSYTIRLKHTERRTKGTGGENG